MQYWNWSLFSCRKCLLVWKLESFPCSVLLPYSQRYGRGWALASSTTRLHCCLSFVFSIHCFIFITFKSATTSSIHLKRGLPLLLPINSLPSIIFLGIALTSILFCILSVYGSIQFFIIYNYPNVPLLDRPIDPPQHKSISQLACFLFWSAI